MKFADLILHVLRSAEIPLRFEPGAEEALLEPILGVLKVWLAAHEPERAETDFDHGQAALVRRLIAEVEGSEAMPG